MHPCVKHQQAPLFYFAGHTSRKYEEDYFMLMGCECTRHFTNFGSNFFGRDQCGPTGEAWDALQLANFEQHTALWTEPERNRWKHQLFGGYAAQLVKP